MTSVFLDRGMLYLLVIMPLLLLLLILAAIERRRALSKLVDTRLSARLVDTNKTRKRGISGLCRLAAFGLLVLGLARPAWDSEVTRQPKTGRDLVFLLDISQSMLAEDQPPNRLVCAKNSILQCLDEFHSGRVGLVVFAGSVSIRCPLTRDLDFFRSTLDDLAPDSVPIGGTRIGEAVRKTVEKVLTDEDADFRDVILITDGGNHGPVDTNALSRLSENGSPLIIVGLGSDSVSSEIPIRDEESGKTAPLIYRDRVVRTVQHSQALREIAEMVPGSIYLNVGTSPLDLADIYETHVAATVQRAAEELNNERPREQYWRFLLGAMALLIGSFLPWMRPPTPSPHVRPVLTLVLFLLTVTVSPLRAGTRANLFGQGVSAYRRGAFASALESFNAAQQKKPDPRIDYNIGTTFYRLGDMQSALLYFGRAAETAADQQLSVAAAYNTGNTLFSMAFSMDSAGKEDSVGLLKRSIAAFESALEIDPAHENALFNVKIARQALAAMKGHRQTENKDGTEEREVGEDEEPTQQSESPDLDSSDLKSRKAEEGDAQAPPNLTPEEILEEEERNKLGRKRKKHVGFTKTRKNW